MDSTPESLAGQVERLYRAGRSQDAFELALESAQRFPHSSLALTNAGYFYILRGEPARALEVYESAVRANPQNAEARRGLAVAKTQCGIAARGDSVTTLPFRGTGTPVRVLVPITLGSGNVVTERLFDDRIFAVTKLAVELHQPGEPLPAHDVVFNAVGDADSSADALATVRTLLATTDKRVLNDPECVERTGRVEQGHRLAGIDGVVAPAITSIARDAARSAGSPSCCAHRAITRASISLASTGWKTWMPRSRSCPETGSSPSAFSTRATQAVRTRNTVSWWWMGAFIRCISRSRAIGKCITSARNGGATGLP